MPRLHQNRQKESRLIQLPAEVRNMIYDLVGLATLHVRPVGRRNLQDPKNEACTEITLVVKTLPTALMRACQITNKEVGSYMVLRDRLLQEPPRIVISSPVQKHIQDKDELDQLDLSIYGMNWVLTNVLDVSWIYARDSVSSSKKYLPMVDDSKLLGMEFQNDEDAAVARQFVRNLGAHLAWRCKFNTNTIQAKDLGGLGPVIHVAMKSYEVIETRDDRIPTHVEVFQHSHEHIYHEYLFGILRWERIMREFTFLEVLSQTAAEKSFVLHIVRMDDTNDVSIPDVALRGGKSLSSLEWRTDWV